jgi:hypothetical protein
MKIFSLDPSIVRQSFFYFYFYFYFVSSQGYVQDICHPATQQPDIQLGSSKPWLYSKHHLENPNPS